jgi:hypothetical protein
MFSLICVRSFVSRLIHDQTLGELKLSSIVMHVSSLPETRLASTRTMYYKRGKCATRGKEPERVEEDIRKDTGVSCRSASAGDVTKGELGEKESCTCSTP